MTEPPIDPTVFVDQMAAIVQLPLRPEDRQGVIDNFGRIMAVAQLVNEFPLPEEVEIAPIFEP